MGGRARGKDEPLRGASKTSNTGKGLQSKRQELPKNNTLKAGLDTSSLKKDVNVNIVNKNKLITGSKISTSKDVVDHNSIVSGVAALTGMDVDSIVESSENGKKINTGGKPIQGESNTGEKSIQGEPNTGENQNQGKQNTGEKLNNVEETSLNTTRERAQVLDIVQKPELSSLKVKIFQTHLL